MRPKLSPSQKRKHAKGLCITPYCSRPRAHQRNYCHRCNKKRFRENNPVRNAFYNTRTNAQRRGIEFTVSIEEFITLCRKTGYMDHKGRTSESLTLDRIDSNKGYIAGNIQVVTNRYNLKKNWVEHYRHDRCEDPDGWLEKKSEEDPDYKGITENLPF